MMRGSLVLVVAAVLPAACGSTPHGTTATAPQTVPAPAPAPTPVVTAAPAPAPARHKVSLEPELVGGISLYELHAFGSSRPAAGDRTSRLPLVAPAKKGARGDVREIYQKVAPAVVIVHAGDAMGSGVIIRKDGWLLTNYHVVRSGQVQDLYLKVGVELGEMKAGVMQRTNKVLPATVQAVDRARDVALVKIDSPPAVLPFVKLSDQAPTPGEPVASIGHASIGLLWAIKDGEISAIGNVADDRALADLVLAPCSEDMATHDPQMCDARRRMVDAEREQLKRSHAGLVIQTTCDIWHGDSGGPLVDHAGELVGLNDFGYSAPDGGAHSNFHVHVNEIRAFLQQVPEQPHRWIPDPFAVQGVAKYADLDGDGEVDALGVSSDDELALLFDLGQHSTEKYDNSPAQALDKHQFDTRFAYLRQGERSSFLYDSTGSGHFDVLLIDKDSHGAPSEAYRLAGDQVTKDDTLVKGGDIQPALIQDPAERQRLTAMIRQVFPPDFLAASMASGEAQLPDPSWKDALTASAEDHDKDGTPDAYRVNRDWDSGLLIDADQHSSPGADALAALHGGALHAQASLVDRPDGRFAFYDTKHSGSYDVLLHAVAGSDIVDQAYDLDGDKLGTRREDLQGQLLIQPALIGSDAAAHARAAAVFELSSPHAVDPALGAFPDPVAVARASDLTYAPVPHWDRAVIQSDGVMLVDTSATRARRRKADAGEALAKGPFPAQFAYVVDHGVEFFFYDTSGSGRFDLVLVATDPPSGVATIGYRLPKAGQPTLDPDLAGKSLVRPSLFRSREIAKAFGQIAPALFNARAIGH